MKKLILLIVAVVIIGVVVYFWKFSSPVEQETKPEVVVVDVERGEIKLSVSTTGRVVSNLDVEIKCRAGGEVIELPYDVSDFVEKGTLIAKIDPIYEQRTVDQAKVSLSASQAQLDQANLSLTIAEKNLQTEKKKALAALESAKARSNDAMAKADRLRQLLEKKLASQEEYETANASAIQVSSDLENARVRIEELGIEEIALGLKRQDVALAETRLKANQIDLSDAEQRLNDTKVYAPISGVVSTRNVQIGQIISSAISNVGGGTTVMTLSDLSKIFILASVDESDIGRIRVNQDTEITVDAFPGMRFSGNVVRIATKGVTVSNVVTFEVKVEVTSKNRKMLKPEMTANVEIVDEYKEDVVKVPVAAVYRSEGKHYVDVLRGESASEQRQVETGITDGLFTEIRSGLDEKDKIVYNKDEADSKWRAQMRNSSMRGRGFGSMMLGRRRQPNKKND